MGEDRERHKFSLLGKKIEPQCFSVSAKKLVRQYAFRHYNNLTIDVLH